MLQPKTGVFLVSLLTIAIVIVLGLIFYIERQSKNNTSTQAKITTDYIIDDEETSLFPKAILVDVKQDGERVTAQIFLKNSDRKKYKVLLFDKNLYPNFFLTLSTDSALLSGPGSSQETLKDTSVIYGKVSKLKGSEIEGLLPLKEVPIANKILECNKKLLDFLKTGKNSPRCTLFMPQISAYVENF